MLKIIAIKLRISCGVIKISYCYNQSQADLMEHANKKIQLVLVKKIEQVY